MIKANELRLGNWVDLFDSETGHNFVQVTYSLLNAENFIEPIPLTPEMLLKCDLLNDWVFRAIEYFRIDETGSLYFDNEYTAVDIKYLHQLQNLYFALTGEELEINLNG